MYFYFIFLVFEDKFFLICVLSFLFQFIFVITISSFIYVTFTLIILCLHINKCYKWAKFIETRENTILYTLTYNPSKLWSLIHTIVKVRFLIYQLLISS